MAADADLRAGCWLEAESIVGPGAELKSAFLFDEAAAAQFNVVGDSILSANLNLEAGAIIANHRNEAPDRPIALRLAGVSRPERRGAAPRFGRPGWLRRRSVPSVQHRPPTILLPFEDVHPVTLELLLGAAFHRTGHLPAS